MANTTFQRRKPYIPNYDLIGDIPYFFEQLYESTCKGGYIYISATERRCFNLAYRFFGKEDDNTGARGKLLSNYGLLHCHKEISKAYIAEKQFPRIMLIDDLMVHGRGMSKFLYQLETLIAADLKGTGQPELLWESNTRAFRHRLIQAVDIFVYAQSDAPLLLDEQYIGKLQYYRIFNKAQMHDLSLQLSDALPRWRVANTSFVYSERCKALADIVTSKLPDKIRVSSGNWTQVHWTYAWETMELFLRFELGPKSEVTKVSTIRYYPRRMASSGLNWFTSFSVFGSIPDSEVDHFCSALKCALETESKQKYPNIIDRLSDNPPELRYARSQILYFFQSVVDFRKLCADLEIPKYLLKNSLTASEENILSLTDVDKVCRNFGLRNLMFREFCAILQNSYLLDKIEDLLKMLCSDKTIVPLFTHSSTENADSLDDYDRELINREAEIFFYNLGIDAENNAAEWLDNRHLFRVERYQELRLPQQIWATTGRSTSGLDGILPLKDYHKKLIEQVEDTATSKFPKVALCKLLKNDYYRTAAMIAIMDYGIMGVRLQSTMDNKEISVCKAGELAPFARPRQISIAIPAYTVLEQYSWKRGMKSYNAVQRFCDWLTTDMILRVMPGDNDVHVEELSIILQHLKADTKAVSEALQQANQKFWEWNFINLISRPDALLCAELEAHNIYRGDQFEKLISEPNEFWIDCQHALVQLAEEFLS